MTSATPSEIEADMAAAASMPARSSEPEQQTGVSSGPLSAGDPASIAQIMVLLSQLIQNMPATIAAAVKVDKPSSHLDNAKLDVRNFSRIQTFTNNHSDWREWKNQFAYAVCECDNVFGSTLSGMEKG